MQREIRRRARGGRHGPRGEVPSPDLGEEESGRMFHLKSSETETEPSWQVFFLLLFFFVWKIPVKWLLIYAKSNQQLIHNAWATRYQFCNAFRLLDAITNAADEILALLPLPPWLRGRGGAAGQERRRGGSVKKTTESQSSSHYQPAIDNICF